MKGNLYETYQPQTAKQMLYFYFLLTTIFIQIGIKKDL